MLTRKRKLNYTKSSVNITKGRERIKDKNRNKEQEQLIEKSNKYGGY